MDDFDILLQPTDLSTLDSNFQDLEISEDEKGKENTNINANSCKDDYPNLNNSPGKLRRRLSPNKKLPPPLPKKGEGDSATSLASASDSNEKETKPTFNENIPIELLAEFTLALSKKDYEKALKYCNEILIIDSGHELANKFSPLLRRAKFELGEEEEGDQDEENANEDSESETETETDTDSEEVTTDSNDEDSKTEDESDEDTTRAPIFGLSLESARSKSKSFDHWRP